MRNASVSDETPPLPTPSPHGWQARLSLLLQPVAGKTRVIRQRHSGPLRVQRAFYPEGETCHLYLLHPPAGVVGGDVLHTDLLLRPGARALLTQPGATQLYRSAGATAQIRQHFRLGENATLEWLPPGTLCFSGARARLASDFHLSAGSSLLAWETLCLGRPVLNEPFSGGQVVTALRIWREGELLFNDLLRITAEQDPLAGYPLHASLFAYPASDPLLDRVRAALDQRQHPAGATLLDRLMVVRLLDRHNLTLEADLRHLWSLARPAVIGLPATPPRIWNT